MRAVVFDLGHTLIDYRYDPCCMEPEAIDGVVRLLSGTVDGDRLRESLTEALKLSRRYKMAKLIEIPLEKVMRDVLTTFGIDDPAIVHRCVMVFHEAINSTRVAMPGACELLEGLRERGLRIGLISDVAWGLPSDLSVSDMREMGIDRFFDDLVFSTDVLLRKPNPEIFEISLHNLGVDASEAAYVGNTRFADVRGSKSVGMTSVLMTSDYDIPCDVEPDVVVDSLDEVIDALDL